VDLHHASVQLGFDGGFVDQHDGNVVLDSIYAVTLRALQGFRVLTVFERLLAGGTHEDFKEIFGEHTRNIVRQNRGIWLPCAENAEENRALGSDAEQPKPSLADVSWLLPRLR
jgi:hypothetical protein